MTQTPWPSPSHKAREKAKIRLEMARLQARRYGFCDGRGECTCARSREREGRRYCVDCGRPKLKV